MDLIDRVIRQFSEHIGEVCHRFDLAYFATMQLSRILRRLALFLKNCVPLLIKQFIIFLIFTA